MTERIDVFYSRVPTPIESTIGPVYHKYLVYTDKAGKRHSLRAGPTPGHHGSSWDAISPPSDPNEESPYGPVRFEDGAFEKSVDYEDHPNSLGEPLLAADDLSGTWQRMRSAFHNIEPMNYQYWPRGVNSNTIVDATLARSGNHPTYRDGTAGNSEWTAPDREGQETIRTPGLNRLPPPPGFYEKHRKPRAIGKQRSSVVRPKDLVDLPDEEFAQATHGPRWRQIWERE